MSLCSFEHAIIVISEGRTASHLFWQVMILIAALLTSDLHLTAVVRRCEGMITGLACGSCFRMLKVSLTRMSDGLKNSSLHITHAGQ